MPPFGKWPDAANEQAESIRKSNEQSRNLKKKKISSTEVFIEDLLEKLSHMSSRRLNRVLTAIQEVYGAELPEYDFEVLFPEQCLGFTTRHRELLKALWSKGQRPEREIIRELWGFRHDKLKILRNRLRQLIFEVNNRLVRDRHEWKIERLSPGLDGCLALVRSTVYFFKPDL